MRRWHDELPLLLHRWREELRKHDLDPAPYLGAYTRGIRICSTVCDCEKGPGVLRKRHPGDCGRARCGLCHWSKVHRIPARRHRLRYAFQFEEAAETDGILAIHAGRLEPDAFR
ncbi:MAG TPA: hypothetical protein VJT33_04015 [bacterium]|nr:hypothetical protein [bacterium]